MTGRKLVGQAEHMRVALRVYTALDMMIAGAATVEEWNDLSDGLNILESLSDLGKVEDDKHRHHIERATEGMVEAIEGLRELGRMRMGERGLDALKHVISEYDLAIGRFSQQTLAAARAHFVVKVARAKHKPDPSVRVVAP